MPVGISRASPTRKGNLVRGGYFGLLRRAAGRSLHGRSPMCLQMARSIRISSGVARPFHTFGSSCARARASPSRPSSARSAARELGVSLPPAGRGGVLHGSAARTGRGALGAGGGAGLGGGGGASAGGGGG